ncbi:cAMP-dependent protein kinase regulator [Aureococcus anophagefferens]|nr:cAMP-dependent protein kinase regulator [Aureococcus anophagefferens]
MRRDDLYFVVGGEVDLVVKPEEKKKGRFSALFGKTPEPKVLKQSADLLVLSVENFLAMRDGDEATAKAFCGNVDRMSRTSTIEWLGKTSFLQSLSHPQLELVSSIARFKSCVPEQTVIEQGAPTRAFYIVLHGNLRVTCGAPRQKSRLVVGASRKISGGGAGEAETRRVTERLPRATASVVATEETLLLVFDAIEFFGDSGEDYILLQGEITIIGEDGKPLVTLHEKGDWRRGGPHPLRAAGASVVTATSATVAVVKGATFRDLFLTSPAAAAEFEIKAMREKASAAAVLTHPSTAPLFKVFLDGDLASENYQCWDAIADYRAVCHAAASGRPEIHAAAQALKKRVVEAGPADAPLDADAFEGVEAEINKMLKGNMMRFCNQDGTVGDGAAVVARVDAAHGGGRQRSVGRGGAGGGVGSGGVDGRSPSSGASPAPPPGKKPTPA